MREASIGSSRYSWFCSANIPVSARVNARNRRSASTPRQSVSTEFRARGTSRGGSTASWARVSSANTTAATTAEVANPMTTSTLPSSGPSSAPTLANTLNSANASARRSPASWAR